MAASYPSALPTKSAAGANLSTNPHSALHDDLADEVVAIATELGTNPKGTSASVVARLNTIQAKTNGIIVGSTTATTTAGGGITITFGVTFTAAPHVFVMPFFISGNQIAVHQAAAGTTTTQNLLVTSNNAVLASTGITLRWLAIGTLA